jgi:hypothetical protein
MNIWQLTDIWGAALMREDENIHSILHKLEETVDTLTHCNEGTLQRASAPAESLPFFTGTFPEDLVIPIANIMTLHLSMGARLLLLGCLLQNSIWGETRYCFNEIASMVGISDRTAYRALKEIKASGLFKVDSRPGIGVNIELDSIRHKLESKGKTLLCRSPSDSEEPDLFS